MKFLKYLANLGLLSGTLAVLLTGCGGDATSTSAPATTAPSATTAAAATTVAATTAKATAPATAVSAAVGIGSASTTSGTTGGLTMKEAYALAEPQIKSWQGDQFLFSIFNTPDSGKGINPEGRSAEWNFQAISAKENKRGTWLVRAGKDGKGEVSKTGEEELRPGEAKAISPLPPVSSLIDSPQLMNIAKQNGGDKSDNPVGFFLAQPLKEGDPLAVDLVFYKGSDVVRLRINMRDGTLVQNTKG